MTVLSIRFAIPIAPRGKERGRAAVVGGRARVFRSAKDRNHGVTFSALAAQFAPDAKIEGPVVVEIEARMERPKSMLAYVKKTGEFKFPGRPPHVARPDADNIGKMVLDAMKSWWRDDSQVCDLRIRKVYTDLHELPCYIVTVGWSRQDIAGTTNGGCKES